MKMMTTTHQQQNQIKRCNTDGTTSLTNRPNTLNIFRSDGGRDEKTIFIREALIAWRAKARCNLVPAERLQELFHELQFNPSEKQISEMLQTAKLFARRGNRQSNGLTFGEFCVLAADLKRFRMRNFASNDRIKTLSTLQNSSRTELGKTKIISNSANYRKPKEPALSKKLESDKMRESKSCPEVFLGGSCNPTTWRADVAIPTLQNLGISFYNPQVSDWTPDLIDLEYRAKEKARVLFFVMDSETRASAGAIEVAYIAGQNARQLVLVLHSYQPNQCIFNEPISAQEYTDLSRNQQLLRELVSRRGLPVLDNIRQGLQRTKQILAGIRDPPSNIASILILVRNAFDRVADASSTSLDIELTLPQCQRALSFLGYAQSLLSLENLKNIIQSQKESLENIKDNPSTSATLSESLEKPTISSLARSKSTNTSREPAVVNKKKKIMRINFNDFCVLSAYLSVLQQDIYESGCISPIKGTNLPPPPIFLAHVQGLHSNEHTNKHIITKQLLRTSSCSSVPDDHRFENYQNNDSGTSSPQPFIQNKANSSSKVKFSSTRSGKRPKISLNTELITNCEESDSNDSVFSSASSINSNFAEQTCSVLEFRDVYLGGSCFLRTKWRQEIAIPYFESKGITYHLPSLHESITSTDSIDRNISGTQSNETKFDDSSWLATNKCSLFNSALLDSSRVLLFVITNETRSLAPMTLAAHCIGLMYNVVLCVKMIPEFCMLGNETLTPTAVKDYNRARSYLIDLAKRQGVPVFHDLKFALDCTVDKIKACNLRNSF